MIKKVLHSLERNITFNKKTYIFQFLPKKTKKQQQTTTTTTTTTKTTAAAAITTKNKNIASI